MTAITAEHDLHVDRAMFIDFEGDLNHEAGSLPWPRFRTDRLTALALRRANRRTG